jgi:hypothetical protein
VDLKKAIFGDWKMEKRSCIKLVAGISLLILMSLTTAETAKVPEKAEMDVETLLEKARQAQRPTPNLVLEVRYETVEPTRWSREWSICRNRTTQPKIKSRMTCADVYMCTMEQDGATWTLLSKRKRPARREGANVYA